MIFNILHELSHCFDVVDLFVRNFDLEFVLNRHQQIHNIQGISAQVVGNGGFGGDRILLCVKLLTQDCFQLFQYQ